ncbi:hypothetical protein L1887_45864 [Cichorium endivia]|nr:hypothetical protein L1887_45864 [Cichorium endivia]
MSVLRECLKEKSACGLVLVNPERSLDQSDMEYVLLSGVTFFQCEVQPATRLVAYFSGDANRVTCGIRCRIHVGVSGSMVARHAICMSSTRAQARLRPYRSTLSITYPFSVKPKK